MKVTIKQLEILVHRINECTGNPLTPSSNVDGKYRSHPGNYHLGQAYGGIKLYQMANDGGGVRDVSTDGYGTKKQLFTWLHAFIAGLELRGNA